MTTTTFEGNVTAEPELRFTPAGTPVLNFSIADNRRWTDRDNVTHDDPTFLDVVVWKDLADNCAMSLGRGMRVIVEGRLEQRFWTTDDGQKRSKHQLVANSVGISLRWARVEAANVVKTSRSNPAVPDEAVDAGDPALAMARTAPAPTVNPDEEPF